MHLAVWRCCASELGVPEHRCCIGAWEGVLQELKALRGQLYLLQEYARDMRAGPREALDEAKHQGIINSSSI